ncbi:MAG: hypothetical protein M0Q14_10970 [Tissierellaceae bacterium]|nr:hypothetical protein [Tissierellaceae bacterium]
MAIRFFFEFNNQVVQLPVNPEEIMIASSGNNKTEEIVKLGQINLLREKKLEAFAIKCFLPTDKDAPYVLTKGKFEKPQYYIDFFENIKAEKKPFRFIVSGTKINMLAAIEDLEYGLKAGDDDIHYSLSIKEYRSFSSKVVKITSPATISEPTKVTAPATERPKTRFAIGDTVIANGNYWYSSYGANPHGTFKNHTGKISHIIADKNRKYRYHIITPGGGYSGWVAENQIKHK